MSFLDISRFFSIRFSRYSFADYFVSFICDGDGEIRTLDPLLARQVLSQLSYAPLFCLQDVHKLCWLIPSVSGLKWTRTIDLTLIRRAL